LKCLELIAGLPHIPSRLLVRKVGVSLEYSLQTTPTPPKDAAVIGNFKPRLLRPDEEFYISLPRANGGFEPAPITGRICCEQFFFALARLLKDQGRKPGPGTTLRFSEPPFASAPERKLYQNTVRKAAKEAGLGAVSFFREPDAAFEYFRLLRREVPAQGKALNFLVLDFGGGTCNVSVVSTTRQGGLWQRYIAAPVAAEAPSAGGLYIDQELLTQALVAAGIKQHTAGRQTADRKAYEEWLERHMTEAEHLKRQVSETGLAHQLPVKVDGRLAELSGGERTLDIRLDPERLRGIVEKHWVDRGIRDAVDRVLLKLHGKLTTTAQRTNVPDDPRALVTQVLIAGGSSQLPGFVDHVKKYFEPHTPKFTHVGKDFAYSVAVGMGLNFLVMDNALVDERPPVPVQPTGAKAAKAAPAEAEPPAKATDSTFMATFPDDLCLFWVPPKDLGPQLLYPEDTSPFDLLERPQVKMLEVPGRSGAGYRSNRFQTQSYGYQICYRNDEEAPLGLSLRRLNVGQHQLQVPADVTRSVTLKSSIKGEPGRHLDLILEVLHPATKNSLDTQSIPLLSEKPPAPVKAPPAAKAAKAPPPEVSEGPGRLLAQKRDVLCIDFGTTNTTLIDLDNDSEVSIGQFQGAVLPIILTDAQATPLPKTRPAPAEPVQAPPMAAAPKQQPAAPPPLAQETRRVVPAVPPPPPAALIPPEEGGTASTQHLAESLQTVVSTQSNGRTESSRLNEAVAPLRPKKSGEPFEGTERDFLDHVEKTCRDAGFEFPRELLETLYLSLKVRPFVVLAGPSGVGKSALAQLMAEACGGAPESKDLLRIAVEAHWTDSRFILGRRDGTGFRPTDFYRLLRHAQSDRLHHVLLDEMNLAHVEYYFAQLLSAMESDCVLSVPDDDDKSEPLRIPALGPQLPLLRLYGTINVDESTQVLSDKVIDRVNVIEVEAQPPKPLIPAEVRRTRQTPRFHLTAEQLQRWHQLPEKELKVPEALLEIWALMARRKPLAPESSSQDLKVWQAVPIGQRIIRDIALFVHHAEQLGGALSHQDAVDLAIKQRILPKIRGDLRLQEKLAEFSKVLEKHNLSRSAKRLEWMRDQLEFDQFVTFWA
jgi:energy-coupling factor transporter ATP-binding protein EcfA2